MKNIFVSLVILCGLFGAVLSVQGCSTTPKGTLAVSVADAPGTATSILITVSQVQVHKADNTTTANSTNTATTSTTETTEPTSGWETISFKSGANPFDLIKITGLEQVLATDQIAVGQYTQIRMTVSKVEVTYSDGSKITAKVPSSEIKFVQPFQVEEGQTTTIVFDFDASKSLVSTGASSVNFTPVIKLSVK